MFRPYVMYAQPVRYASPMLSCGRTGLHGLCAATMERLQPSPFGSPHVSSIITEVHGRTHTDWLGRSVKYIQIKALDHVGCAKVKT